MTAGDSPKPSSVDLDDIGEIAPPEPTDADSAEYRDYASTLLEDHLTEREAIINQSLRFDHSLRQIYAPKLYRMMVWWLVFVSVFLVLTSIPAGKFEILGAEIVVNFDVSDQVIMVMLGSTTAAVIGMFLVVAKWMFPGRKGRDN
ncbi:MAG: hypothetical protein AAF333_18700 [Planctomycetota bacterium]